MNGPITEMGIAVVGKEEPLDSVFCPGFGIWLPRSGDPTFAGSKALNRKLGRFKILFELDVDRLVVQRPVIYEVLWRFHILHQLLLRPLQIRKNILKLSSRGRYTSDKQCSQV